MAIQDLFGSRHTTICRLRRKNPQRRSALGITQVENVLADGKKTIDTLKSTKNQTKTARLLGLTFSEVHTVMERSVARGLSRRSSNTIYEHICMDEKAIRRGHEYVSILYDGKDGTVIEVVGGRKTESVKSLCTNALTERQRDKVETVCTDMWSAFTKGAVEYFPNALHCHDLYHCVAYLNEAVDKVRKREIRNNCELKKSRFLWLKSKSRYTSRDESRVEQLRKMNLEVVKAWEIKELFRDLVKLHYDGVTEASRDFYEWFYYATSYNIEEVDTVAFMFKRHVNGIQNAFVTRANNGKAERMNGSIQELQTIGRGYRNAQRARIAILFFYGNLDIGR